MERVPMTPRKATPVETSDPEGTKRLRADARRNRARILAAAEEVFSEQGASAPTEDDLLRAIMKDLLLRLTDEVNALNTEGDPATALFAFFTRMVEQAAAKKTVVELLTRTGVEVQAAEPVQALRQGIHGLLTRAQQAGAVREDVRTAEVMALLTSTCQGALHAGWDADLQRRTLTIVFNGLRPRGMALPAPLDRDPA